MRITKNKYIQTKTYNQFKHNKNKKNYKEYSTIIQAKQQAKRQKLNTKNKKLIN